MAEIFCLIDFVGFGFKAITDTNDKEIDIA